MIVPGGEVSGVVAWTRVRQIFTSVPRHPVVAPGQGTRPRTRLCRVTAGCVPIETAQIAGQLGGIASPGIRLGLRRQSATPQALPARQVMPLPQPLRGRAPRLSASSSGAMGHALTPAALARCRDARPSA